MLGKCKGIIIFGLCIGSASLPRVFTELARIGRTSLILLFIPTKPLTRANRNNLLADSPSPYRACIAYGFRNVDIIALGLFCHLNVGTRIFSQPGTCQTIFVINNHEASIVLFLSPHHEPMGLGRAFRALVRRDRLFDGALHEPLGIPDTRLLNDDA